METKLVHFLRERDYIFEKELGQGACGKTVLLNDDVLNQRFVCKKYSPYLESQRKELFENFIREIKLLHQLHHQHVVRVFNYYLYPDKLTGYILMEYVDGTDIEEFVTSFPEQINELFLQVIEGFSYLESKSILHRDIRAQNILVCNNGTVKIIDLGFGKHAQIPADFGKSISLNLWCDPPSEFTDSLYDFRTEVYFVGKLFEKLIQEQDLAHFKYKDIMGRMCCLTPDMRIPSFFDIQKEIKNNLFFEIKFSEEEINSYREFSHRVTRQLTQIKTDAKYIDDFERIKTQLEAIYRNCMLEEYIPDSATLLDCFINGGFYYRKNAFPVEELKNFLKFLKSCSTEKKRIVLANLHTRFDAIPRYSGAPEPSDTGDDDIPF